MSRSLFRRVSRRVVRTRKHRIDGWVSLYCRTYGVGPHGRGSAPPETDEERRDDR